MDDRFERLSKIAPKLAALQKDPEARVNFEWMSGALVWSDELPSWDELEPAECHCLRGVWRYRTTLIMGKPEEKFRPAWEYLLNLCPTWPGFSSDRRQPNPARAEWIEQASMKATADWEELNTRFERQKAEAAQRSQPPGGNISPEPSSKTT